MRLFSRFSELKVSDEGISLVAFVSDLLQPEFVEGFLDTLRSTSRFRSRQAFGELLTLIAFRDRVHSWAIDKLERELVDFAATPELKEPVAVGVAFAAAHLWDEPQVRTRASSLLARLIPHATKRVAQALGTVFWAREDFAVDEATEGLLRSLSKYPHVLSNIRILDLVEHLVALLPHERHLILGVCQGIVNSGRRESNLFEVGPNLVKIAMTLQRFDDTRAAGLSLLEDLLRLGLDDAYRVLGDIDIRPTMIARREPRPRRRRRKP